MLNTIIYGMKVAIDSDKWDIHEWARLFSNKTIYGHLNLKPMWFSHLFTFFNHLESKKHSNKKFLAHRLYKNRQCQVWPLFHYLPTLNPRKTLWGPARREHLTPPEDTADELWTASLSCVEQSKGRGLWRYFLLEARSRMLGLLLSWGFWRQDP